MAARVVHFEIGLRDAKNIAFYRKVFGWPIPTDNPWNYGIVEPEGENSIGGGIVTLPPDAPSAYVTVYVAVEDVAASLAAANREGGKTLLEPQEIPDVGIIAQFSDPEGNRIGLFRPFSTTINPKEEM